MRSTAIRPAGADQGADAFKEGKNTALVATDVAARGLDIDQLPLVVNYEPLTNAGSTASAAPARWRAAVSRWWTAKERRLVEIEKLLKREFRANGRRLARAAPSHGLQSAAPSTPMKTAADDWF
jgi:hypothetical protein